jgi:hypothetical protein
MLSYYNKAAGTLHAAPEIVLFSDFEKSSKMDKRVLNDMREIDAEGVYFFNKIYIDDRELWPDLKRIRLR